MSHVLTVKIPHPLLDRLNRAAEREGKTKGALVREAIDKMVGREVTQKEEWIEQFRAATKAMMEGKRPKSTLSAADWERLRKKAALAAPPGMTPEKEVLFHRRRGL